MSDYSYRTPPLEAIRGFVAVARRMSITLASQDLFLTQSAVSRQIQAIEEYLGVRLLVRKHRAIELTAAGEELLQLAAPWFDRLIDFSEKMRDEVRSNPVTITANIGFASLWILPKLGKFQAQNPDIDVRVAATNLVLDFSQSNVDLAVRYCREVDAPRGAVLLFGEQVVPVASKEVAAVAFQNRGSLNEMVLLELDVPARPWLRWADWLNMSSFDGVKPRGYLHFNQYDQVINAAIEGHGVALGRLPLVQPMLNDGRLVAKSDVQPLTTDSSYWLVKTEETARQEVEIFASWIVEEVQAGVRASPCES